MPLFDPNRLVLRQKRAIRQSAGEGADFLVERIAEDFSHRLAATNRDFVKAADLFSFSDKLSSALLKLENVTTVTRFELPQIATLLGEFSSVSVQPLSNEPAPTGANQSKPTQEKWPNELDLVVSAFGLHSNNDLPRFMNQIFRSMNADGLLMICLPIKGTLHELRDCLTRAELELTGGAAARIDPFIDISQAGSLLHNTGFKLTVIDREELILRYDNAFRLIDDLRLMGATSALNAANHHRAHRQLFKRTDELYRDLYADEDGRIRASFSFAYLTGWTPHENQQQPLKPGSAKVSLADHLKSK